MSWLSDIAGGGAQSAASAQQQGLLAGLYQGNTILDQNPNIINSLGNAALSPFETNMAAANQGTASLGNLLGLNGAPGSQSALAQLQTTPGYQFQLGQGDNAINASAAAGGTLNSGNQLTALSNFNQGLAGNTYQNAVSNLQPYLGFANSSAGGNASVLGNMTGQLTNNNDLLAQLAQATYSGIGNAQASADLKQGQGDASLLGGALSLGSSLLGGLGGLGGIGSTLGGGLSSLFGGGGDLFGNADLGSSIMGGSLF